MSLSKGPTLEDRLVAVDRRPTGFDYLRLLLALSIIGWHTVVTSYGDAAQEQAASGLIRPFIAVLLPFFFSLSGFLVAGSLERCRTLISFGGLRLLRILPALVFEVLFCALVLGPIFTRQSLQTYFTAPEFRAYFLNVVGDIHYVLPGVFTNNPNPSILNGQLWTIPFELKCYATLMFLAAVGVARRSLLLIGVAAVLPVAWGIHYVFVRHQALPPAVLTVQGWVLVSNFLAGVAFYDMRRTIRLSGAWCLAALAFSYVALTIPGGELLTPIPLAYATIYIGMLNPRKVGLLRYGDYSYGLFLFGYPIQQAFCSLGGWAHHWWLNFLVCAPLAGCVAAVSWTFVEKPALGQKRWLMRFEDSILAASRQLLRRSQPAVIARGEPRTNG